MINSSLFEFLGLGSLQGLNAGLLAFMISGSLRDLHLVSGLLLRGAQRAYSSRVLVAMRPLGQGANQLQSNSAWDAGPKAAKGTCEGEVSLEG